MLTLDTGKTLQGVAGTNNVIACWVDGMELVGTTQTYKQLAQSLLPNAAGIIYTVPASTTAFLKTIVLSNTTAVPVIGVSLYVGGTGTVNLVTGSFTIPDSGWAIWSDGGWRVYNSNGALVT